MKGQIITPPCNLFAGHLSALQGNDSSCQCCGFIWEKEEKLSSHSALQNVDSRAPDRFLMPGAPLGFSPQPNNTHRAGSVWVFATCAAATPPSLQKASSERCTHYHCDPFVWITETFGKLLWNSDSKKRKSFVPEVYKSFNDKHMARTEAKVTPRLKAKCSTAGRTAERDVTHPTLCPLTSSASFSV